MICQSSVFQAVRIIDVFVLGPAMINAGRKLPGMLGGFLILAGAATIVFNGATFLQLERKANAT